MILKESKVSKVRKSPVSNATWLKNSRSCALRMVEHSDFGNLKTCLKKGIRRQMAASKTSRTTTQELSKTQLTIVLTGQVVGA
jgi:hypothetical protein